MLPIYFMRQWFALSDLAMQDELRESEPMRRFVELSLIDDAIFRCRNPAILRAEKGLQWYFCMKAHIGIDTESAMVHGVTASAASVDDKCRSDDPLHGVRSLSWVREVRNLA